MVQASICTIGDEILIGQIIDTNSSHISRRLEEIGVKVTRMVSFGDDRHEIISNLSEELRKNDIVVVTGGLGPTKDDITKDALAELSGSRAYREDAGQLEMVHSFLHARGLDMLPSNRAQALVPETCEVIVNRNGTAPIMVFRFGYGGLGNPPMEKAAAVGAENFTATRIENPYTDAGAENFTTTRIENADTGDGTNPGTGVGAEERDKSPFGHPCTLYSLPGVPFEAIGALDDIVADITAHYRLTDIYHKTIMTFGIAESALAARIADWEDALPEDMHLAYLPNYLTGVRLRLSIYGGNREEEAARIDAEFAKLRPLLGDAVYAERESNLQTAVGELLRSAGKTLSVAESCTGGMISQLITSVPGASDYFLGSVTSYANSVKENVLVVPESIIEEHGAVSGECVAKMAEGVRRLTGSDFSVATSGIAGPGGGSDEKPVGLVWIGVASASGTKTENLVFKGDRARNVERFAAFALDFLRREIVSVTGARPLLSDLQA